MFDTIWQYQDTVYEGGLCLDRYVMEYDYAVRFMPSMEDQRVLVEAGLIPDRWEYLETYCKGMPYAFRQYSGRNENIMYEETMFIEAHYMTEENIQEDPLLLALQMAQKDHPDTAMESPRNDPDDGNRRLRRHLQLDGEAQMSVVEFPEGCIDKLADEPDEEGACARISRVARTIQGDPSEGFRFDAVFRDEEGQTAELYGQFFTGLDDEVTFVQGNARGCATPKKAKVGRLAEFKVALCKFGNLDFIPGSSVSGSLGASGRGSTEIKGKGISAELRGSVGVNVDISSGKPRLAGIGAALGVQVEVGGAVRLSADGLVDLLPESPGNLDVCNVLVRVRPAVEVDLGLFSKTLSYTFRVVELGPLHLGPTTSLPPPRVDLPPVNNFRQTSWISPNTGVDNEESPDYWRLQRTRETNRSPEAAVSGIQVIQRRNSFGKLGSVVGLRTWVEREGISEFDRRIGSNGFIHPRIDMDDDEWIVGVSGYWYDRGEVFYDPDGRFQPSIYQLTFDTNKGRQFDYSSEYDFPDGGHRFSFRAADGEAFYGIDAYTKTTGFSYQNPGNARVWIKDRPVLWFDEPDVPCMLDTCIGWEDPVMMENSGIDYDDNYHTPSSRTRDGWDDVLCFVGLC